MNRKPKKKVPQRKIPVVENPAKIKLAKDIAHLENLLRISEREEDEAAQRNNEALSALFFDQSNRIVIQLQELRKKAAQ